MNENAEYIAAKADLPDWFNYPPGFANLVEQGVVHFAPWHLAKSDFAMKIYRALHDRYNRELFPIAHRQGSDDIACLEKGSGHTVKIINGYTSIGHENEGEFASFWEWFRHAIDDVIEFNS